MGKCTSRHLFSYGGLRFQILVACRETGSLPEQVKQKENLCDHNIQLKNLN